MEIRKSDLEAIAIGGLILGGGGGGSSLEGQKIGEEAFRHTDVLKVIDVSELPANANVLTISAVGAPSATEQYVKAEDYLTVIDLLEKVEGVKVDALITNEMGGGSSFNAFIPSVLKNIPMLDVSCNGRAHPLGTMGAMGLSENNEFITTQTAVGGNPQHQKHIEMVVKGTVPKTSNLVRQAAVEAGGLVVVARNAVSKEYIEQHAALGSLTQSLELGKRFLAAKSFEEKITAIITFLGGKVACRGKVTDLHLEMEGGLDKGSFIINEEEEKHILYIWNEYMALEKNGVRQATFPDLLMTFDEETSLPVTSAEIKDGQNICVIQVPYKHLLLGAGMKERTGYERIEETLSIEMLSFVGDLLK